MNPDGDSKSVAAKEVLRRYKEEDLPDFFELPLEDVNQVGHSGDRPLHVAVVRGNIEDVKALIMGGADVNAHGDLGNTPLHEAAGQGHFGVARFLLESGASLREKNEFDQSPLDVARLSGRDKITRLLTSWESST